MFLGGGLLVGWLALSVACLVGGIYTCVDAGKYPDWAFGQAGTSKFTWQILPIILVFFCGLGAGVMAIIWISGKRDEVARAAASGLGYGGGPYGGPTSGWGPPGGAPQWGPPPAPPAPPSGWPPPPAPPAPPPPAPRPPAQPPQ